MSISCGESVKIIKEAKKEGLAITCGVAAHHLYFNDTDLEGFDANLKVMPPIRSKQDQKALLKGVKEGTIDVICSDHQPEDIEHKKLEFEIANFGIGAIEQTFAAANSLDIELDTLISKLTVAPRAVFNLEPSHIEEGAQADITFFDPTASEAVTSDSLTSLAWNNPYISHTLTGKVQGVVLGDRTVLR